MYDTSIPTLAYVFIGLTSLVITYSHIMSNQDEGTNQDGMPEFVDKEIMDEDMIQVDEPENIEDAVAPVEANAMNNVAEQSELLNPQGPPQMNPAVPENQENPINQDAKPEAAAAPVAVPEENKNQGGKKKKTKKKSKKQKQSKRSLRNKKKSKKANKKGSKTNK